MEAQIAAYHAKHHGGPEPESDDEKNITKGEIKAMIAAMDKESAAGNTATTSQKSLKSILKKQDHGKKN